MTSSRPTYHAAIVGGGLVGKCAALALSQAGLRVALLAAPAAAPAQPFDARVYALSSSSQALLDKLRIWQALAPARLCAVRDMRVFGDAFAELHFSAYQAAVPQLAWIIEAALIEHALDAALRFMPQLDWRNARAQTLVRTPQAAHLTLDDHSELSTELIVGADGAHSWVRAQIDAKVRHRDYGQTGVVANFSIDKPHGETAFQWFRGGEVVALLPLPGNYVSLVWSAGHQRATELLALDGAQLARAVERASGGLLGTMECVTPAQGFALARQDVDRLIAPRVALVGDAAHLIHPLAGQGMNLGLRDVAELEKVLSAKELFRDFGDQTLLRRYERARREDIRALTLATDGLQRLFAVPGVLAQGVRNAGMALVGTQPLIKRWLVSYALG